MSPALCMWCDKVAILELRPSVDGIANDDFDPYCLECAETHTAHWRVNKVTWEKRPLPTQDDFPLFEKARPA